MNFYPTVTESPKVPVQGFTFSASHGTTCDLLCQPSEAGKIARWSHRYARASEDDDIAARLRVNESRGNVYASQEHHGQPSESACTALQELDVILLISRVVRQRDHEMDHAATVRRSSTYAIV